MNAEGAQEAPAGGKAYFRDDDAAFLLRDLDGLTLIYHRPSGITHIVASPVPEIWAVLSSVRADPVAAIRERLSRDYDLDPGGEGAGEGEPGANAVDLDASLGWELDQLCALGLVRAV